MQTKMINIQKVNQGVDTVAVRPESSALWMEDKLLPFCFLRPELCLCSRQFHLHQDFLNLNNVII